MRGLMIGIGLLGCVLIGPARAGDRTAGEICLSSGDALEVVSAHQVVTPGAAAPRQQLLAPSAPNSKPSP